MTKIIEQLTVDALSKLKPPPVSERRVNIEKYNYYQGVTQMRDLCDYLMRSAETQGGAAAAAGRIRVLRTILGVLNTELNGGSTRPSVSGS